MNTIMLAQSLCRRLEYIVRNIQMPVESEEKALLYGQDGSHGHATSAVEREGGVRAPMVHNGYLPVTATLGPDAFPYVIVRPIDGETTVQNESVARMRILIGGYEESSSGYEYCLLVMEEIRAAFMKNPILDGMFTFQLPFEWRNVEESDWPYWSVQLITRWVVPTPQLEDPHL